MIPSSPPPLIVIVGPTASGKSRLALELARRRAAVLISADALQVYRGFDAATGKPTPEERAAVPHALLDVADPREPFSAGDFARAAEAILIEARAAGRRPIVVGGTGLYVRALLRGLFAGPARDEGLRLRLRGMARGGGPRRLHRLLTRLDPARAGRLAPLDLQRVIRALEIRLLTGRTYAAHLQAEQADLWSGPDRHAAIKIGLEIDRTLLAERIAVRVRGFFAAGLVDEVRRLLASGVPPEANAFKAIGYREAIAVVQGTLNPADAVEATIRATRRYARRQMAWFRREPAVRWLDAADPGGLLQAAASLVD